MKYVNFAVGLLTVIVALTVIVGVVHLGSLILGGGILSLQLGSLMVLLIGLGFLLVVLWAEKELWRDGGRGRESWILVHLILIFGLVLMQFFVWEESIFKFIYEGIRLAINNLYV